MSKRTLVTDEPPENERGDLIPAPIVIPVGTPQPTWPWYYTSNSGNDNGPSITSTGSSQTRTWGLNNVAGRYAA